MKKILIFFIFALLLPYNASSRCEDPCYNNYQITERGLWENHMFRLGQCSIPASTGLFGIGGYGGSSPNCRENSLDIYYYSVGAASQIMNGCLQGCPIE